MSAPEHSPSLSVVLPAYNERQSIEPAVMALRDGLAACGVDDWEALLIDDGSTDGTGAVADGLAGDDTRLRVIHHGRNRGQVAALITGFASARGAVVTHNGVDLPFAPIDTARALGLIETGADVVVVQRSGRAAYGPVRKLLSVGNVALLRLLLGSPYRDHNFVQFFRREVLATVRVRSNAVSTVTPELILRARRLGYCVVTMEADYRPRTIGRSSITPNKVARAIRETLRLRALLRLPDRNSDGRARSASGG